MRRSLTTFVMALVIGVGGALAAPAPVLQSVTTGKTSTPDVRVGGGPLDGQYIHFAKATCGLLGKLYECDPRQSDGSGANVENLRKPWTDPKAVDAAFMKGSMAEEMQKQPDFGDHFEFIRYVAGEAVLLVVSDKYRDSLPNWAAVRKNVHLLRVGLPGEKAGDTAVFRALSGVQGSVLPKFKEVKMYPNRTAMIEAVQKGEVHIGWLMMYANPDNDAIAKVNAKESGLSFMGVVDPDFLTLSPSVDVQAVPITNAGWFGLRPPTVVTTTTMKAAIVARSPRQYPEETGRRDTQQGVIQALRDAKEDALLPDVPWIKGLVNSVSLKTSGGLNKVLEDMRGAAEKVKAQF